MVIRDGRVAEVAAAAVETIVGETIPRATSASHRLLTLGGLSLPHRLTTDGTETVVRPLKSFPKWVVPGMLSVDTHRKTICRQWSHS
jgi:hypothetical protein